MIAVIEVGDPHRYSTSANDLSWNFNFDPGHDESLKFNEFCCCFFLWLKSFFLPSPSRQKFYCFLPEWIPDHNQALVAFSFRNDTAADAFKLVFLAFKNKWYHSSEAGPPVGNQQHIGEQFFSIFLKSCPSSCITGALNTGLIIQGRYFQAISSPKQFFPVMLWMVADFSGCIFPGYHAAPGYRYQYRLLPGWSLQTTRSAQPWFIYLVPVVGSKYERFPCRYAC